MEYLIDQRKYQKHFSTIFDDLPLGNLLLRKLTEYNNWYFFGKKIYILVNLLATHLYRFHFQYLKINIFENINQIRVYYERKKSLKKQN